MCTKCGKNHYFDTEIGKQHLFYSQRPQKSPNMNKPEKISESGFETLSQRGKPVPVSPDELDSIIKNILDRESWFAPRVGRTPMTTKAQVLEYLENPHNKLYYGDDWYMTIQAKKTPKKQPTVEMVKCDCGHTIPKNLVMAASLGTSCPDCYDRMSG